ncbi:FMN-binding negative transcriptional regulator [Chitinolyticbacter meiyuanensis]|uniref:FMN-binding negative transcriptional regulator n=1 Tax=Chitinolyticbacter meiyuanensis TaxID=682798 RepID=UPI0011E59FA7|nr:FMN-binding negative transcriptional regulator [Chitinolyticbacter meiyuanensis]
MYTPSHFAAPSTEDMHALITAQPLGTLVVCTANGLDANPIPLELDRAAGPWGTLHGHVARANPLWHSFDPQVEALVIFQGPDAYISPSWYPSKAESGKVVPTWNYVTVHAYGTLRVIDDAAWLRAQLEALTARHEAGFATPWQVADAPAGFIDKLLPAIVGIEISISRLQGKWKASQNQPRDNQLGVIEGLRGQDEPQATAMAALVAQHRKP